jgi:hypothetical protein
MIEPAHPPAVRRLVYWERLFGDRARRRRAAAGKSRLQTEQQPASRACKRSSRDVCRSSGFRRIRLQIFGGASKR